MGTRGIKILLVDNDSDYCRLVKMALQKATGSVRFAVETAGNLAAALKYLESGSFDLV